jgi:hypothetical protein
VNSYLFVQSKIICYPCCYGKAIVEYTPRIVINICGCVSAFINTGASL